MDKLVYTANMNLKVVCVRNHYSVGVVDNEYGLTIGRLYIVSSKYNINDSITYTLINDLNEMDYYPDDWFMKLEDYRSEVIGDILG